MSSKSKLAELALLGAGGNRDVLDLAADVALFVGEEEVEVAVAGDERLAFEPRQRRLDLLAQGQLVGVDLVDTQGDQVVDAARQLVDVANEEEDLEDRCVEGLRAHGCRAPGRWCA